MRLSLRSAVVGTLAAVGLVACGGEATEAVDEPLNIDYSSLQPVQSREEPLVAPRNAEQLLRPIRNGLRMSTQSYEVLAAADSLATASISAFSATNVQVEGVDESDNVKYDGHHIFSVQRERVRQSNGSNITRNILKVFRTHPESAQVDAI